VTQIRVMVADDHPVVVMGLGALFRAESDIEIIASAENGRELLQALQSQEPDVLLIDRNMPEMDGLQVLRALRDEKSTVKTVLLGATLTADDIARALRLGARGVVLKERAPAQLIQCVRTVAAGGWWLDHGRDASAIRALVPDEEDEDNELTERERELARLTSEGMRNKEIAARLGITEGTVKVHLNRVYRKLGVDSRVALALRVRELGL
jgi:DNA-binding NarL/FixJ family response regulator